MLRGRDQPELKGTADLARMREAGRMVAEVLAHLAGMLEPGVTTGDLNEAAGARMAELGAERASFLGYVVGGRVYPANICVSIDDEIVHGIPGRCLYRGKAIPDRSLHEGQIVSIDCGVVYEGFHGDSAVTLPVGEVESDVAMMLDVCRDALWAGIRRVKPGNHLSDVARAIEGSIRARDAEHPAGQRWGVVEEYVGHGIGRKLHEPPRVPNYLSGYLLRNDVELEPGLVIAIEPMVCLGSRRTRTLRDGWTVVTRDGSPACHFEHTVAVTEDGFEVLTRRADDGTTH